MRFDILTLFPDMFPGYMSQSLLKLAIERELVSIHVHNIRDWATSKHKNVDDRPYGGGPGMVLSPQPVVECTEAVQQMGPTPGHLVMLTPGGRRLDQRVVEELSQHDRLVLMCGRYEGFDQRIIDLLRPDEISIGDFILNGGEVAAMVVVDAVLRLVPGVLGDERSNKHDSFSTGNRLLEYAHYTRPPVFRGLEVPQVLLSGNHTEIAQWREQSSLERTRLRRADLLKQENREGDASAET